MCSPSTASIDVCRGSTIRPSCCFNSSRTVGILDAAARLRGQLAIFGVGHGREAQAACLWLVDVPVPGTTDVSDGDAVALVCSYLIAEMGASHREG